MASILRRLVLGPIPRVSEGEALQIARSWYRQQGWEWLEPVTVNSRRGAWLVATHVGFRGLNGYIKIDNQAGRVLSTEYYPR